MIDQITQTNGESMSKNYWELKPEELIEAKFSFED